MTNEEAIKEIQDASDYEVRHGDIEHHHEDIMRRVEAFEKAVNALQKEPLVKENDELNMEIGRLRQALEQEHCGDTISKASVFEILGNLMSIPYDFDRPITEKDVSESMDAIRALPPVTPTCKKGKWICVHHIENKITYDSWKCSECQHDFSSEEESMVDFDEYKYCPNCGADMRGAE